MPEGDTVHQVARLLAPDLAGQVLRLVQAKRLDGACLIGARVTTVVSEGKHLYVACDNGLALRSHLGLYGSWHRYAPGEAWQRPTWQASLVLKTDAKVLVCFNAKEVEILASKGWRRKEARDRLGPDLSLGRPPPAAMLARIEALTAPETLLADLLLNQGVAAGIGNIYKCEALFLAGLSPLVRRGDLPADTLTRLYELASDLLVANLGGGPRVTRRGPNGDCGLWVYGRARLPCLRCGEPIRRDRLGLNPRSTYWCPSCQSGP